MKGYDFRQVPGCSRLYGDYLYDFPKLSRFYRGGAPYGFRPSGSDYPDERRRGMAEILRRQNLGWGAASAGLAAVERFAKPGTVAIVAGQQVGLFGGPLLTMFKAATAVKLAARLREQGTEAVAIFWMATQDHDWDEVNHVVVRDQNAGLTRIALPEREGPAGAVGPRGLGAEVEAALTRLEECTGASVAGMRAAYAPGGTMADGFARAMTGWFGEDGLLVFDPMQAPETAAWVVPTYREVLRRQPEWRAALATRERELEAAGYHRQVQLAEGATLLFVEEAGARVPLRRSVGGGAGALEEWERHPERFSPAALLRPVIQDELFPTAAQITGPAETAYLAQSAVLYETLGRRQPVVYPRASATLVDAKARRILEKYEIEVNEVWGEAADKLLARRALPPGIESQTAELRSSFAREFGALTASLQRMDPTLVDAAQGAAQKIEHQLQQLEARVGRGLLRRNEELSRHAAYLAATLFPGGQLQERELAAADFATRSGPALVETLRRELALDCPEHQWIEI